MYSVLIVDDDEPIRTGLKIGVDWHSLDCKIVGTAKDGNEALRYIENNQPDIVLSDIQMKEFDGFKLCRVLLEQYPKIKCILLTGFYEFDNAYNAIQYKNVITLVLKPTSPSKICDAMHMVISRIEQDNNQLLLQWKAEQQMQQINKYRQSLLLLNIIEGGHHKKEVKVILDEAKITLKNYLVVTIQLHGHEINDGNGGFLEEEEIVYKYADHIFAEEDCYIVSNTTKYIHIIINQETEAITAIHGIRDLCVKLYGIIDNLTNFFLTIGISKLYTDVSQLYKAASESENAAKFALYYDERPVVEYSSIPQLTSDETNEIRIKLDELFEHITKLELEQSIERLDNIYSYCLEIKVPFNDMLNICILISNTCSQQHIFYRDLSEESLNEQYNFYSRLCKCDSVEALYTKIKTILKETINHLSKNYAHKVDIIDSIDFFIKKNYASDLSLSKIAAVFCLSPGYLGRIFKSKRGVNISIYIQNVRIEKSKELIKNSDLYTYEIAEAVGFSDPVYFSKIFKKVTGYRVRDYRTAIGKDDCKNINP